MKASTNSPAVAAALAERTVAYNDVRIQYRACGSGLRVVLLPSLGRDVEDYFDIAGMLAVQGCRAIMPSPRGIGASAGSLDGINLHDFARDVIEVLRHDGGGPAVIAGHAFGNWVARVAAIDYPDIVFGVAVLAAAHKNIAPELRSSIDKCMDISLPTAERLANLQATFFAPGHDATAWLAGWHPEVARAQRRASAATPKAQWWHAGQAPVLDVQADSDVFAPASGAHLLQEELGADRVDIVVVPDAGHALLPEQPEAVAQALAAFVKKTIA